MYLLQVSFFTVLSTQDNHESMLFHHLDSDVLQVLWNASHVEKQKSLSLAKMLSHF